MVDTRLKVKNITPIFRMFDVDKAKDFYLNFLEFSLDWEHRYEEDLPLYIQISLGDCSLHLSEHHGDSSPGVKIRIEVEGIKEYHKMLISKNYKYARPGLEHAHGHLEMTIADPFGNHICFYENIES